MEDRLPRQFLSCATMVQWWLINTDDCALDCFGGEVQHMFHPLLTETPFLGQPVLSIYLPIYVVVCLTLKQGFLFRYPSKYHFSHTPHSFSLPVSPSDSSIPHPEATQPRSRRTATPPSIHHNLPSQVPAQRKPPAQARSSVCLFIVWSVVHIKSIRTPASHISKSLLEFWHFYLPPFIPSLPR